MSTRSQDAVAGAVIGIFLRRALGERLMHHIPGALAKVRFPACIQAINAYLSQPLTHSHVPMAHGGYATT